VCVSLWDVLRTRSFVASWLSRSLEDRSCMASGQYVDSCCLMLSFLGPEFNDDNYCCYWVLLSGVGGIATRLRSQRSGVRIPVGLRNFCKTPRLAVGPTQLPIQWIPGLFPSVKRLGREVTRSPPCSAKVTNAWHHSCTAPIPLNGVGSGNFTFYSYWAFAAVLQHCVFRGHGTNRRYQLTDRHRR
jgi:hypothetical protein